MDRSQQHEALISDLQIINALIATIIITEPLVFPKLPPINYAPGMSWSMNGETRALHTQTFKLALLKSGVMAMRTLSNLLGLGVTKKQPYKLVDKPAPSSSSDDLHVSHITGARGLTVLDVMEFSRTGHPLLDEHGVQVPFDEVYLRVLKVVDKSVAHLTHDSEWSSYYSGAIVGVGTFVTVAIQIAVLRTSWNDAFDELVFSNTKQLLPTAHHNEYMKMIADYHADMQLVLA